MVEAICIAVYGLVTLFLAYLCGRSGTDLDERMFRILLWPITMPIYAAHFLGLKHKGMKDG
jgi:hypothetical protein